MSDRRDIKSADNSNATEIEWDKSDIIKLAICWALTLTTSTLLTTIAPLAATDVGVGDSLASFTVGCFLIGAALSSVPSGWLFRTYGRFVGFSVGCLCQIIGSVSGAFGLSIENYFFLYAGCLFVGLGQGLGQFYRFAAVEISPEHFKSSAVTYVLSGGVIAAFLGPTSASYTANLIDRDYVGSFLAMALIGIANFVAVWMVKFPVKDEAIGSGLHAPPRRPLLAIVSEPLFVLSCMIPTIAHTVMIMVMSNCALSMKDDYSFSTTTIVLETHFLAMFLPGFFTGWLISLYGTLNVSVLGGVVFGLAGVTFLLGTMLWNYITGMVLIGIAWNFSFSAGTVMLMGCYLPHEAADVQAVNDFILFTVASAGSLASGYIFSQYGWYILIYTSLAMMIIYLALFGSAHCMKEQLNVLDDDSAQKLFLDVIDEELEANHEEEHPLKRTNTFNNYRESFSKTNFSRVSISSYSEYVENSNTLDRVRQISVT